MSRDARRESTHARVARLAQRLRSAGVPTPAADAELLVRHVTGWSRAELALRGAEPLDAAAVARLEQLAARRARREPLQLIVGTVGFRHLDLLVRPGVFIPRPETEVLAGEAVARTPAGGVVVEPCTGTGAVACAVAQEAGARSEGRAPVVVATDVSPAAVALARDNAARAGVAVQVLAGDLLDPLPRHLRGRVDVVVSNPPYLAQDEVAGLEPEVTDWDPLAALVAGPTGHEAAARLIAGAPAWLRAGGWLLLEVADSRARPTAQTCEAAGYADVAVLPDLAGRDRIVVARRCMPAA